MKKILCLCLGAAIGFCSLAYGQSIGPKQFKGRKHHPHAGTKSLGVQLTPTVTYVAGTTMDIYIDGVLASVDDEYGDSLSITFPAGITVLAGSLNIGNATLGQSLEPLIGVNGQTIEWGDNDNLIGGIEVGTFNFFVRITIPANQTGPINCTFHMDGDMYGAAPNFFQGAFAINPTPTTPDFAVVAFDDVVEYPIVPLQHVKPITFYANVFNLGAAYSNPISLDVTSQAGGFSESVPLQVPFGAMTSQLVNTSNTYTPAAVANYEMIHNVNFNGDFNPSDNSDTVRFTVSDSVMARENGVIMNNIGFNGGNGRLGQQFELQSADEITSASFFSQYPFVGDSFRFEVYSFGTAPGTLLAATPAHTFQTTTEGWFTVAFDSAIALPAGKFFLCVVQYNFNNLSVGVNDAYYRQNTNFITFSVGASPIWEHAEVYNVMMQYALRANFGGQVVPTLDSPILVSPANGAQNVDSNSVLLDWSDVNGATNYYYEVSTDVNFASLFTSGTTTASEITISGLSGETEYFWQVQAASNTGVSLFSAPYSFTTQGPPNSVLEMGENGVTIFPNPTSDYFYLQGDFDGTVEIYSILGERIKVQQIRGVNVAFSCIDLANGNYFVKLTSAQGTQLKKLIVVH